MLAIYDNVDPAKIIEAVKDYWGVIALAVLVITFLAFVFFKGAPLWTRILIFLILLCVGTGFGVAFLPDTNRHVDHQSPSPTEASTPTPTATSTATPTPTPPSVYTSPTGHYIAQASCHPHCKPGQGDWYNFQESIPYPLNPTTARLEWSDPGAKGFDTWSVTVDNKNHTADVSIQSRTGPVTVRVQGDAL